MDILILILITLLGLCVGSFCNVLIFRIPRGEEFVKTSSHCMSCGHKLRWFENIPLLSFLLQKGRCRSCGVKLSAQYPAVEAINALLWLFAGILYRGDWLTVGLYCLLISFCIVISLIDWRSFEIPNGLNLAIFILGLIRLFTDFANWKTYLIGMLCVSAFFLLLWFATRGNGIGMGDVKLMGAAGLLLGWQNILLALIVGSVAGSIIHMIRMRRSGEGKKLAFGPYLSAGIVFAALLGERLISAYLGLFGL